jgi:uroporphyrinogen-III synthase
MFFSPSAVEVIYRIIKSKKEICFCIGSTTASALEAKKIKILIPEIPTVEDVIIEVIQHYKPMPEEGN